MRIDVTFAVSQNKRSKYLWFFPEKLKVDRISPDCFWTSHTMNGFEQFSIVRCNKFIKSNGLIEKSSPMHHPTHTHTHDFHIKFHWSSIIRCRFCCCHEEKKIIIASFIIFFRNQTFSLIICWLETIWIFSRYFRYLPIELLWIRLGELELFQKWPV